METRNVREEIEKGIVGRESILENFRPVAGMELDDENMIL
jgi:hypothetical protein